MKIIKILTKKKIVKILTKKKSSKSLQKSINRESPYYKIKNSQKPLLKNRQIPYKKNWSKSPLKMVKILTKTMKMVKILTEKIKMVKILTKKNENCQNPY